MTPMRFTALAAAYGGEIGNWPTGTQDEARALLGLRPELQSVLQEQRGLDTALAAWTVAEPGAALTGRIVTAAAQQSRARRWRAWLSGLGAATVLAGGVAAGVIVVTMASPAKEQGVSSLYQLTVLGAPLDIDMQTTANGPA